MTSYLAVMVITISGHTGIMLRSGFTHANTSIARQGAVLWVPAFRMVSAGPMLSAGGMVGKVNRWLSSFFSPLSILARPFISRSYF